MKVFKRVLVTLAIVSLLLFLTLMILEINNPKCKTNITLLSFAIFPTTLGLRGLLEKGKGDNLILELVHALSTVMLIIGVFAIGGYILTVLDIKL